MKLQIVIISFRDCNINISLKHSVYSIFSGLYVSGIILIFSGNFICFQNCIYTFWILICIFRKNIIMYLFYSVSSRKSYVRPFLLLLSFAVCFSKITNLILIYFHSYISLNCLDGISLPFFPFLEKFIAITTIPFYFFILRRQRPSIQTLTILMFICFGSALACKFA